MKWEHEVNLDWMKARQECLTASDVVRLIPFTATGRPKTIKDDDYAKVCANKMVVLTEDDCKSYGAAARGHILEPYAIDTFNGTAGVHKLYHWDDVVITCGSALAGRYELAFSPDACNIEQGTAGHVTVIGEVKSYNAERHYKALTSKKEDLEERWQIATAMATLPTIEIAYLIFFNPSFICEDFRLGYFKYSRADLADEIETVLEVHKNFNDWADGSLSRTSTCPSVKITEETIIADLEAKAKLNP